MRNGGTLQWGLLLWRYIVDNKQKFHYILHSDEKKSGTPDPSYTFRPEFCIIFDAIVFHPAYLNPKNTPENRHLQNRYLVDVILPQNHFFGESEKNKRPFAVTTKFNFFIAAKSKSYRKKANKNALNHKMWNKLRIWRFFQLKTAHQQNGIIYQFPTRNASFIMLILHN